MDLLSREDIEQLTKLGPATHPVNVDAWGGRQVLLREMDGLQSLEWDMAQVDRHKDPGLSARIGTGAEHLVQLCLIDSATNQPMFSPSERTTLVRNMGGALQELYQRCVRINRLRSIDRDEDEKK